MKYFVGMGEEGTVDCAMCMFTLHFAYFNRASHLYCDKIMPAPNNCRIKEEGC